MSEQNRTEQRNGIGRREVDFELPAMRLLLQEHARTITELRLRVNKAELDLVELKVMFEELLGRLA